MKRQFFTGLKAFAVSAIALLAVSCYDDSDLWGELENQAGDIASLTERVAALESKLNTEVQTLNGLISTLDGKVADLTAADKSLLEKISALTTQVDGAAKDAKDALAAISELSGKLDALDGKLDGVISDLEKAVEELDAADGELDGKLNSLEGDLKGLSTDLAAAVAKIAVVKVEKNAAGNYVLTFADGQTLEVSAADANANNAGLVTVVDGKWAVVGADGKTTVLDAAVHPDTKLEFKVDTDTFEVLVSYDGTTWEKTGVFVKDSQTINVVTAFADCKDYVVVTVGGVQYKLPKVSTNSFDIVSGMVFFEGGETKNVPVSMSGVVSSMVAKQPAGWEVVLTSAGALQVTAPGAEGGDDDYGYDDDLGGGIAPLSAGVDVVEDYGTVEVWVVTEDGKTFVGKLMVSLAGNFTDLTVTKDETGAPVVKATIPSEPVDMDWETGEYIYGPSYYPVYYGACKADEFDPAALRKVLDYWEYGQDDKAYPHIFGNYTLVDYGDYVQPMWTYENEFALADMLGGQPEFGTTYVIWSYNSGAQDYTNDDLAFVKKFYSPTKVECEVTEVKWNDVKFNVSVEGADQFFLGVVPKLSMEQMMYFWSDEAIKEFQQQGFPGLCFYDMITGQSRLGSEAAATGSFVSGSYNDYLTKILGDEVFEVFPSEEFCLCVLPVQSFKDKAEYSLDDLFIYEDLNVGELLYGGKASVALTKVGAEYTNFTINVKSTDSDQTVYNFWTTEEYTALVEELKAEDLTIVDYMIDNFRSNFYALENDYTPTVYYDADQNSVKKGVSYTVVAFAIDKDGKVSQASVLEIVTPDYPYNRDLTVTVENVEFDATDASKVTVTFAVTGATKLAIYKNLGSCLLSSTYVGSNYLNNYELNLMNGKTSGYAEFAVEEGKVVATLTGYSTNKYNLKVNLAYSAFNTNDDSTLKEFSPAETLNAQTWTPPVVEEPEGEETPVQ